MNLDDIFGPILLGGIYLIFKTASLLSAAQFCGRAHNDLIDIRETTQKVQTHNTVECRYKSTSQMLNRRGRMTNVEAFAHSRAAVRLNKHYLFSGCRRTAAECLALFHFLSFSFSHIRLNEFIICSFRLFSIQKRDWCRRASNHRPFPLVSIPSFMRQRLSCIFQQRF